VVLAPTNGNASTPTGAASPQQRTLRAPPTPYEQGFLRDWTYQRLLAFHRPVLMPGGKLQRSPEELKYNLSGDALAVLGGQVTCQRWCKEKCEDLGKYAPVCIAAMGNPNGDYFNSLDSIRYSGACSHFCMSKETYKIPAPFPHTVGSASVADRWAEDAQRFRQGVQALQQEQDAIAARMKEFNERFTTTATDGGSQQRNPSSSAAGVAQPATYSAVLACGIAVLLTLVRMW
jgi:hypothetical protein